MFSSKYCDVHIPQIQEMLDKIPTPLSGAICNEKTGWLPPNFDDNAREILSHTIMQLMAIEAPEADAGKLLEKNDPEGMIDDDDDDNDDDDDDSIIEDDDNEIDGEFLFESVEPEQRPAWMKHIAQQLNNLFHFKFTITRIWSQQQQNKIIRTKK